MSTNQNPLNNVKTIPYNPEIESMILGCILLDSTCMQKVANSPIHKDFHVFHNPWNQKIYKTMWEMYADSEDIDLATIVAKLRKKKQLEAIGGVKYIHKVFDSVNSTGHLETYISLAIETHTRRKLHNINAQFIEHTRQTHNDVFNLITDLQRKLLELQNFKNLNTFKTPQSLRDSAISRYTSKEPQGIPTMIRGIDEKIGGLKKGKTYVIAGRPGMGKSSLAFTISRNVAKQGKKVGLFSLEMENDEIIDRLFAMEWRYHSNSDPVNYSRLGFGNMPKHLIEQMAYAYDQTWRGEESLYLDDSGKQNHETIEAKITSLATMISNSIDVVVIDHIGLSDEKEGMNSNRARVISKLCAKLKSLAKETKCSVIEVCQLNRSVETRGGLKQPELSDLKDSGGVEESADVVMLCWRPAYYQPTPENEHDMLVRFAKNRQGSTTSWENSTLLYCEISRNYIVDYEEDF